MKCIKSNNGEVTRVSDDRAARAVKSGAYNYCAKSEWKAAGRKRGITVTED